MAALLAAAMLLAASAVAAAEDARGFSPIEVEARPVSLERGGGERRRYGRLAFRGGLVLTSPERRFGGFSGLGLDRDGRRLLAITDEGNALEAELVYSDGRLSGLRRAGLGRLKGSRGQDLPGKVWSDAEALAFGPDGFDGPLWVSFEHRHRIERYDFGRHGLRTRAVRTKLPPPLGRLPLNHGVEAMARFGPDTPLGGAFILFGEDADAGGMTPGALLGGPSPGPLGLRNPDGHAVTDAAVLPGGDLVVLERFFGSLFDFSIRLRRIAAKAIRPGARLSGEVLFEGGIVYNIDNFEGLAVHTEGDEVRLTLISDNNFSRLQRTLLMQFAIVED